MTLSLGNLGLPVIRRHLRTEFDRRQKVFAKIATMLFGRGQDQLTVKTKGSSRDLPTVTGTIGGTIIGMRARWSMKKNKASKRQECL